MFNMLVGLGWNSFCDTIPDAKVLVLVLLVCMFFYDHKLSNCQVFRVIPSIRGFQWLLTHHVVVRPNPKLFTTRFRHVQEVSFHVQGLVVAVHGDDFAVGFHHLPLKSLEKIEYFNLIAAVIKYIVDFNHGQLYLAQSLFPSVNPCLLSFLCARAHQGKFCTLNVGDLLNSRLINVSYDQQRSLSSFFTYQNKSFDVFLSFRGEDTRFGFTGHLYNALCQLSIHTFIDDNLPRGEQITAQLLETIESSMISIIIFSENYVFSTWCSDELVKIVECKKNAPTQSQKTQNPRLPPSLNPHPHSDSARSANSLTAGPTLAAVPSLRRHSKLSVSVTGPKLSTLSTPFHPRRRRSHTVAQSPAPLISSSSPMATSVTWPLGSEKIRGMMICTLERAKLQLEAKSFEKMKKLKFLIVANVDICGDIEYLPNELRLLDWPEFPLSTLPSNFHPQKLIALNMPQTQVVLEKLLKFRNLTYMNFRSCQYIMKLSNLSTTTPNIKQLNLNGCRNLVEVHDSVGCCLDKLEKLELYNCTELRILPSFLVMKSPKHLDFYMCTRLEKFPDIPHEMDGLKYLTFIGPAIRDLPPSFGNLTRLEELHLGSGTHSEDFTLPESIIKFNRLRWLEISDCYSLREIPKLPKTLRGVDVSNCFSLNSKSLSKLLIKFGRILGLLQNVACLDVRGNIIMDSRSSSRLSHQTDLSSWVSPSKFFEFEVEFRKRNQIPEWFNHQSVESSISLWVGPEFPTFALCLAFSRAGEDEYGYVCVVDIFTDGHKQMFLKKFLCRKRCDHL
uniref:TIR domain-containing protein n=1 Tax=Quercus lobata TaxID=97700 RepID=A0A7N2L5G2_QUELO